LPISCAVHVTRNPRRSMARNTELVVID
jgi:hypothetical protein